MRGLLAPLIKLVVFLVITSIFTYVLAVTISNKSFGSTSSYKAQFTDVTGLESGDDVRIAGVRVGTVGDIKIVKRKDQQSIAQVSFTVQKSTPLTTAVFARLRYRNLVGQRYIDVEQGAGVTNSTPVLKPGSLIKLDHTAPAVDLTVLFAGFKPLVEGLDANELNKLSLEIIQTLQGESGSLELLLSNLADLTNSIADKDQVIGEVIDNLSSVLTAVGQRDNELTDLIIQLKDFVSGLAADRKTIGNSIDGINQLATTTAGLLTKIRAPLAKDVTDLTGLLSNLNQNKSTIQYIVQQLPPTVAGLIRTADYGSWFNFYLCSLSGSVSLGTSKVPLKLNLVPAAQQRCTG